MIGKHLTYTEEDSDVLLFIERKTKKDQSSVKKNLSVSHTRFSSIITYFTKKPSFVFWNEIFYKQKLKKSLSFLFWIPLNPWKFNQSTENLFFLTNLRQATLWKQYVWIKNKKTKIKRFVFFSLARIDE